MNSKIERMEVEKAKLLEVFKDIDKSQLTLVEGLIDDVVYLKVENMDIKELLMETGMIKTHPDNKTMQKPMPAAREYRQNVNSYAVVVKTLSTILLKHGSEEEDGFENFMREFAEQHNK